jgi:hypothetical protein
MLAQLVIKLKRAESSRAELATSRASSRATSILPSPIHGSQALDVLLTRRPMCAWRNYATGKGEASLILT